MQHPSEEVCYSSHELDVRSVRTLTASGLCGEREHRMSIEL